MVDHRPGVYMDHASATPLHPSVREAMAAALDADMANPESLHEAARAPLDAINAARLDVAQLIGADPDGVIFTAGETEARNLAVKGIWSAGRHSGAHIVTTAVEHDSVTNACRALQRAGAEVTFVGVDEYGRPDPHELAAAVRDDTVLVSIASGQSEIGTLQDVAAICLPVRSQHPEVAIHVDAAATAGLAPVDATAWGCDAISIGGSTLHGPRWAGALWVRPGTRLHPLIDGGAQEGGKRAGHHDLPGIVGLGVAARLAMVEGPARAAAMTDAADRLIDGLRTIDGVLLNGPRTGRIPGHVNVSVDGVEGEAMTLLLSAHGVACAPGSACSSAGKSSAVLEAIGLRPPRTLSAILFTLDASTSGAQIDRVVDAVRNVAQRLRDMGVRE